MIYELRIYREIPSSKFHRRNLSRNSSLNFSSFYYIKLHPNFIPLCLVSPHRENSRDGELAKKARVNRRAFHLRVFHPRDRIHRASDLRIFRTVSRSPYDHRRSLDRCIPLEPMTNCGDDNTMIDRPYATNKISGASLYRSALRIISATRTIERRAALP